LRGLFSDLTIDVLAKSLDASGLRHRVIADNIANVETPGFTRSDVSFCEELERALASTDADAAGRMVNDIEASVYADLSSPARSDGNNVCIDKEMAELVKNSTDYEVFVRLLNFKFAMLNAAMIEGKR